MRRIVFVLALCGLLATVGTANAQFTEQIFEPGSRTEAVAKKPVRPVTISVDCARGESINKALSKLPSKSDAESVIEIHGMCEESVVVQRMANVTLRGTDPEQDGISWDVGQGDLFFPFSSALMIADTYTVRVENLMLSGSRPLRIYFSDHVNVVNGQLLGIEGGSPVLYVAQSNGVDLANTTISSPDTWAMMAVQSPVHLADGTVSGRNGIYSAGGASVRAENLAIDAAVFAIWAEDAGSVWLKTSELAGDVVSQLNASVLLEEVTQFDHGSWEWSYVGVRSSLRVSNGSQMLGPIYVEDFSNAVVMWGSTVIGDLECYSGGDAFCDDPSNIGAAYGCPSTPWLTATESAKGPGVRRPDLTRMREELHSLIEEERFK